jgi:Zn-dependent M28 family amino/carboxypeptidase
MMQYAYRADLDLQDQWMFLAGDRTAPHIPVVVVSQAEGQRLVPDLATIRHRIDITPQNVSLPLEREASVQVEIERHVYAMQNVVGIIEGSDPALKADKVVVGAHYDHLGMQGGLTWYGADDDGSGDVALMALAGAFGNGSPAPRRSIVFAAWAGEEKGEYGSRHFVQSPLAAHVVAMMQMDMIGRNEDHDARPDLGVPAENAAANVRSLNIIGSIFSPDLKEIISKENASSGLTLHYRYDWGGEDLERRSDHWNFLEQRIPSVFFFSGIHPDYHTPQDTADKINYPKIESVARLVYRTVEEIANNPTPPRFVDPK